MNRRQFLHAKTALVASLCFGDVVRPARASSASSGAGYAAKMSRFDERHASDVWLDETERAVLGRTVKRLGRVQRTVGFGNFGVMSFDEMLKVARSYPSVGAFKFQGLEETFCHPIVVAVAFSTHGAHEVAAL